MDLAKIPFENLLNLVRNGVIELSEIPQQRRHMARERLESERKEAEAKKKEKKQSAKSKKTDKS